MNTPADTARRAAVIADVERLMGASIGLPAFPKVQPYRPPVKRRCAIVSARVRARNLAALDARVEAWRNFAAAMPAAEARRYLTAKAASLNATIYRLGGSESGLLGVEAADIANARDRLMAALPRPAAT